jgi:2,6-dihydroxypseudooxynicotine hydrolase
MDEMLKAIITVNLPRLFAGGVDHNDWVSISGSLSTHHDWSDAWSRLAEMHEGLGTEALAVGRNVTGGAALARAALYYQFAQFLFFADLRKKHELLRRRESAYMKALPHLTTPGRPIEVPFEGISFLGYLRMPWGRGPWPCVLLIAGADSTKEEFYTLENEFLARGMATFSFDGPGQGLTWLKMAHRPDFEKPVSAILDVLSAIPGLDPSRFGVWGRSLGGYYAPRAAAFEKRIKACTSVGAFYQLAENFSIFDHDTRESMKYMLKEDDVTKAELSARAFTLKGCLQHLSCPLLVIHSHHDGVFKLKSAMRMRDETKGECDLVIYPEGNHACDNISYKVRPMMSDWMAGKLTAGAS